MRAAQLTSSPASGTDALARSGRRNVQLAFCRRRRLPLAPLPAAAACCWCCSVAPALLLLAEEEIPHLSVLHAVYDTLYNTLHYTVYDTAYYTYHTVHYTVNYTVPLALHPPTPAAGQQLQRQQQQQPRSRPHAAQRRRRTAAVVRAAQQGGGFGDGVKRMAKQITGNLPVIGLISRWASTEGGVGNDSQVGSLGRWEEGAACVPSCGCCACAACVPSCARVAGGCMQHSSEWAGTCANLD